MEEECFPAISMDTASGRSLSPSPGSLATNLSTGTLPSWNKHQTMDQPAWLEIKGEPISAPNSPAESYVASNFFDDKTTIAVVSPHRLHISASHDAHTSDSEEDDEEYYQVYIYLRLRQDIHMIELE